MADAPGGPPRPPGASSADDAVADRLVESARRLLAEGGLDQVTMRSVAIGAGVSTMNVYSRFGSKDGLLDVIYCEGFEALGRRLGAIVEPDLPSEIRAFAATYRAFALEHPARYELMFGGEGRGFRPTAASSEVARGVLAAVAARLHIGAERGELDLPPGVDAVQVAATLWALCHGAIAFETGSVADSLLDWSAVATTGVDALIDRYCHQRS
jgi:AcrR family transcriptional regulator